MPDTRELILLRLEALLGTIEGAPAIGVYRDRAQLPDDKLPAMILLDGSESVILSGERRGRVRLSPSIVALKPQIWAVLEAVPLARAAELGPRISAYRAAMIVAISMDETLVSLVGTNGDIVYRGCETDMQTGSSMEGQLHLMFEFHYALQVGDLQ